MAPRSGTFLAGLLTGALVGASLAMVLAPAGVDEARDVLRAKAREAAERSRTAGATPANEMM